MSLFAAFDPQTRGQACPSVVRPARDSDLGRCAALTAARNGGTVEAWQSRLTVDLADPEKLIVVVEVDGIVVGYAGAGWLSFDPEVSANVKDGWYLTGLLVDPAYRRRGLGAKLVTARLDWLDGRADCVWYFASAQNLVSLRLHRQLGFSEVSRSFSIAGVTFTGGVGALCVRFSGRGSVRPR